MVLTPMKAIRKKCLDCSGNSSKEVKECVIADCPLFSYRFGKRPSTVEKQNAPEPKKKFVRGGK